MHKLHKTLNYHLIFYFINIYIIIILFHFYTYECNKEYFIDKHATINLIIFLMVVISINITIIGVKSVMYLFKKNE